MILADSSVWIDHFREGNPALAGALEQDRIACHPFVIGEFALGSLKHRDQVLDALRKLTGVREAGNDDVLEMIERRRLFSLGLGYVDAHLLASSLITPGCSLWTRDKRLERVAADLGIATQLPH